jgi:hypothetical protein
MATRTPRRRTFGNRHAAKIAVAACAAGALAAAPAALASPTFSAKVLAPGSVVVSGTVYDAPSDILTPGVSVLPGCIATATAPLAKSCKTAVPTGTAINDGTYPYVFNNDTVDGSFGVTSPAYLYDVDRDGSAIRTIPIPTSDFVTSFPSKSEMALNFSTAGTDLTLMGYAAPDAAIDISNSNTPLVIDNTNPVQLTNYRLVADLSSTGGWNFTESNAYSGNNGRAAILNSADNVFYSAGNAGNGANPQPTGVVNGAGAQIMTPSLLAEADQTPGQPTPVGRFNITQLGDKADKLGKDTNFRGLTVYNNVVYLTKGSGGNGINTVYFIDTTGTACNSANGIGLPVPGAALPTTPITYSNYNMCVLKGFNTQLATTDTSDFPFGIWFANPDTLYVADEGNGSNAFDATANTYTDAAAQTTAGLQKWVFDGTEWKRAYTIDNGLSLGTPYVVPGYPTGTNVTGLPWAPATDGLRNISGHVNPDGTATIYGVTSTVSGSGDQGADPNKVLVIRDEIAATSPGSESFSTFKSAGAGQALRGVAVVPPAGRG